MGYVIVDVEADGLTPHSGVMTEFGAVDLRSRASFHGVLWEAYPDPDCPAKPLRPEGGLHHDERRVMEDFDRWLRDLYGGERAVLVSDNPAYDFMWVAYYLDKHLGRNPLGHSGRRISDFWAGLQRDFGNTQKWKRYRVTRHDHDPVNDAMGNAEALATLIAMSRGETR